MGAARGRHARSFATPRISQNVTNLAPVDFTDP
jgi:hypothetical protein